MFYSKSTNGFYNSEINGENIPLDAIEISYDYYQELLDGQSHGKIIEPDKNGYPILVNPPAPEPIEIKTVSMRQCRLALLQEELLDDVEALITTREQHIWWDYSTQVEKYNPITQQIASALNWSPEFLTGLFELAITL